MSRSIYLVLLMSFVVPSFAGQFDANTLYNHCQKNKNSDEYLICVTYISAVLSAGINVVYNIKSPTWASSIGEVELPIETKNTILRTYHFCAPSNVSVDQGIKVFLKKSDEMPQHLNIPASAFVWTTFAAAWPCS